MENKFKIKKGNWYVCIRDLDDDYGTRAFRKGDAYYSTKDETLMPDNSNVPTKLLYCLEQYFRPWSIKDAKDGDILASKSGKRIFSYSGRLDLKNRPCAYYGIYETYDGYILTKCAFGNFFTYEEVYPATREQHKFLLTKMQEANWSWEVSSDMKLGINTRGKDVVIFSNEIVQDTSIKQNLTWSEEDEKMLINALDMVEWYGGKCEEKARDVSDWLKSLKQRIKGNG